jgi:hypothetical protein
MIHHTVRTTTHDGFMTIFRPYPIRGVPFGPNTSTISMTWACRPTTRPWIISLSPLLLTVSSVERAQPYPIWLVNWFMSK